MTLDLVIEPEPEPKGYSSSDGEPAYKDGDDVYHGDDDFDSNVEILGCRRPGKLKSRTHGLGL